MYKKLIIIIGLLLLASSVSASDAWWNTSYQYRVPITLTGNTSGAQTHYQLMLNVSYDSNMQSNFNDLRFTNDSGNLQSAWLESKVDDSYANIWVNFTSTPDNGATQTYYMYYGKADVMDDWDIGATFLFGDDFSGAFPGTKWTGDTGYGSVADGILTFDSDGTWHHLYSDVSNTPNMALRTRAKHSASDAAEGPAIGFENDPCCDGRSIIYYTGLRTADDSGNSEYTTELWNYGTWYTFDVLQISGTSVELLVDGVSKVTHTTYVGTIAETANIASYDTSIDVDWIAVRKYAANPPTFSFGTEEEYIPPTPTSTPTPTPTPLPEITSSNYVIQNQTLYITKPSDIQYKITSNSFVYGGSRNINTVICDNNNTVISGWMKVSTDKEYDADYTFFINVNDTSYESRIVTLKQIKVDSSIISKIYRRSLIIDGYEIYNYNTTVYIVSILPNPIYFYFNLEDRIIQFGDKQFNNQTLVFNQLNFDDQYNFMNNASSDTVVMKFKAINPEQKSGAELKGLTGILLNALSKIPFIGKSLKNVLYYPLFFIQTLFNFVFTFLDIIVNDWWYALMTLEIVCIFSASRQTGYANIMEVYINTHVKIIQFIYEVIILNMINLIIKIVVTIKDMIKWW